MTEKTPLTDITNDVTFKVAVDLDGTLAEYDGWKGPHVIGEPIANVARLLRFLNELDGVEIFIFTCRTNKTINHEYGVNTIEVVASIRNWLNDNDLSFIGINLDDGKPFAHVYLDDRAILYSDSVSLAALTSKIIRRKHQ